MLTHVGIGQRNDKGLRGHVHRAEVRLLKGRIECGDVHMCMKQRSPAHYGLLDNSSFPSWAYTVQTAREVWEAAGGVGTR